MIQNKFSISIACPAYNEYDSLSKLIPEWLCYLKSCDFIDLFEIIICDDGSIDQTPILLKSQHDSDQRLRPVFLKVNQGASIALRTAILNTKFEYVLLLDSDGQFPISCLENFAKLLLSSNCDAIIGKRTSRINSLFSNFGSKITSKIMGLAYSSSLVDFNCALKLVRGDLLRGLNLEARGLNYSIDITAKLLEVNAVIKEHEIDVLPRFAGSSSMKPIRDGIFRILFMGYLLYRLLLIRLRVIDCS